MKCESAAPLFAEAHAFARTAASYPNQPTLREDLAAVLLTKLGRSERTSAKPVQCPMPSAKHGQRREGGTIIHGATGEVDTAQAG